MVRRTPGWRAGCAPAAPPVAAERADAEPSTRCRAAAGRLDGHLLDYPRRLSAHRSPLDQFSSWLADRARLNGRATGTERVFQPTRLVQFGLLLHPQ
jgi:hypothetical protein